MAPPQTPAYSNPQNYQIEAGCLNSDALFKPPATLPHSSSSGTTFNPTFSPRFSPSTQQELEEIVPVPAVLPSPADMVPSTVQPKSASNTLPRFQPTTRCFAPSRSVTNTDPETKAPYATLPRPALPILTSMLQKLASQLENTEGMIQDFCLIVNQEQERNQAGEVINREETKEQENVGTAGAEMTKQIWERSWKLLQVNRLRQDRSLRRRTRPWRRRGEKDKYSPWQ